MPLIFFDLEGPLSPQDNAYEVMGLLTDGYKIFEVISLYDDILTLEKRPDYEPGDTLSLIVPFLLYHQISEADIKKISDSAILVKGAKEIMQSLQEKGWETYIISTSYEQHAFNIARKVGVPEENVACTKLPLDNYQRQMKKGETLLLEEAEKNILKLSQEMDEEKIKQVLNEFYWVKMQKTSLGRTISEIKVMGGTRKLNALLKIAQDKNQSISEVAAVGDSITDFKMLQGVEKEKGLAIVFNGNKYALPYGTVGIASESLMDIFPIVEIWKNKGRSGLKDEIKNIKNIHWLPEMKNNFEEIIELHGKYRKIVRGEAAKLG